ncbi:PAS domain-containing hybrid sensor histidine kinase/response regulator [Allosediminivita pacifica]|uniref:histidine kinase n=1 Tax=Allosediminivita pacifica TaxID=1267769 RepID=A0A2T6AY99_9RHOB|nr:ATP-binding protein [Allosediminivita pacifica]PTX48793.1 PAS domain S-box-containing protein [Allosediminivita pacifica]
MPLTDPPAAPERIDAPLPWRGVLAGGFVALAFWSPLALLAGSLTGLIGALLLLLGVTVGALADLLLRVVPTARRRAEALHEGAARLRAIIDTSIDAIIVTDREGRITGFNRAAEGLFGYGASEVLGLRARNLLVAPERLGDLPEAWAGGLQAGESASYELTMVDRGGRRFPAEVALGRGETDRSLYVACLRDVTARHAVEGALREARDRALAGERAKSDFLAVMSHEMRTPLNGLLGTLELMRDAPDDAARAALLARMQGSGALLLDLVNDTLALASYESGTLRPEPVAFQMTALMESVLAAARAMAEANGNTLRWTWVGPPVGEVVGDLRRMRQILVNLATNASKFTRNGRVEIEVELEGDGDHVEFRVIDSGIGIAEADLERIFEDFERVDSTYARQSEGTGLGLGIARRLARLVGGEIGAESEPGDGSVFWLRVPLGETVETVAAAPAPVAAPVERREILLVEDNETNRFIARAMLEAAGHQVTEARNGAVGVELAEARHFDVILMDISMPVMDGIEAARRIRSGNGASRDTPIVAITAHALPEELARFRSQGMEACLTKPLDRKALLATLAQVSGGITVSPEGATAPNDALAAFLGHADPVRARVLLDRFTQEMEALLTRLETETDAEALRAAVHRCAGSCGTFGLADLHAALAGIETALKRGAPPPPEILGRLPGLWEDGRATLKAVRAA